MSLETKLDTRRMRKIPRLIERLERRGVDLDRPIKAFAGHMKREKERTFDQGGRGRVRWPKLAPATISRRKAKGITGRILQVTGALRRSIGVAINKMSTGSRFRMFSRSRLAALHQRGATIRIPSYTIRPLGAGGVLAFKVKGVQVFARRVTIPVQTVRIPKRPVVFFTREDPKVARKLLLDHARKTAGDAVRDVR